ncbi:hydroxyethylthiazole kinase [Virgibacillus xinjiangensis]|uniref:Hydroxyethylthiazole kinase n=1 Tax=Virgibacillus xinjiangensis TaxID=393090 RepID=A0ABV7CZ85_9BACI
MKEAIITEVRKQQPLIHHLTNQVVMNFSANGLLSFGASPVMAKAEEEAAEMAAHADGLLINIGTLTASDLKAMIFAGRTANQKGIPVVLDPVGVAATSFRRNAVEQLLAEVQPTAIKGNAGEMAHLVGLPWETKGVDSIGGDAEHIAAQVARTYETTAIVTGAKDIICTGNRNSENNTGHPLLAKITGAGCLLGSILTACLTTSHPIQQQALAATEFYGTAAEYAAEISGTDRPGTFMPLFIDALHKHPADFHIRRNTNE